MLLEMFCFYTCITPPPGPSDSLRNSSGNPIARHNQSITLTSNSTHAGLVCWKETNEINNMYQIIIIVKVFLTQSLCITPNPDKNKSPTIPGNEFAVGK